MATVVEGDPKAPFSIATTPRKGPLVKSKNILNINMEIIEFEHNKTYKYLRINEANGISHARNREKEKNHLGE